MVLSNAALWHRLLARARFSGGCWDELASVRVLSCGQTTKVIFVCLFPRSESSNQLTLRTPRDDLIAKSAGRRAQRNHGINVYTLLKRKRRLGSRFQEV